MSALPRSTALCDELPGFTEITEHALVSRARVYVSQTRLFIFVTLFLVIVEGNQGRTG